jgi:hypothetical protein
MDDYFGMAGVSLRITHQADELFRALDSELRFYRQTAPALHHCSLILRPVESDVLIPEKAVRTNVWEGKSVYSHGGGIHVLGENGAYLAKIDYARKELSIDYRESGPGLRKVARWLLKWLIIMTAQERGLTYIHASAVSFRGRNVIFCGDSNCGKSSSLLRLVSEGGEAITDDSVLWDGSSLIPFSMNTTIDPDLERRFGIRSEDFQIGALIDHSKTYKAPSTVIFLRIWNSRDSEARNLDYGRALLSLMRIYKKEIPFLWSSLEEGTGPARIFERYAEFLKGASFYELYAGRDEAEVRRKILSLIS